MDGARGHRRGVRVHGTRSSSTRPRTGAHDQGRHRRHAGGLTMRIVAALGGNALLRRGQRPDAAVQEANVARAVQALAPLARASTSWSSPTATAPRSACSPPQSAADPHLTEPYPFDVLGAQTQGMIGYWLLQATAERPAGRQVAAIINQTLVPADDPAFDNPDQVRRRGLQRGRRPGGWPPSAAGRSGRTARAGARVVGSPVPQRRRRDPDHPAAARDAAPWWSAPAEAGCPSSATRRDAAGCRGRRRQGPHRRGARGGARGGLPAGAHRRGRGAARLRDAAGRADPACHAGQPARGDASRRGRWVRRWRRRAASSSAPAGWPRSAGSTRRRPSSRALPARWSRGTVGGRWRCRPRLRAPAEAARGRRRSPPV